MKLEMSKSKRVLTIAYLIVDDSLNNKLKEACQHS